MMRKNGRLEGRYTVPRISHINLNTLTSREMQKLCKGLRENEAPRKAEDAAAVAQQLYGALAMFDLARVSGIRKGEPVEPRWRARHCRQDHLRQQADLMTCGTLSPCWGTTVGGIHLPHLRPRHLEKAGQGNADHGGLLAQVR